MKIKENVYSSERTSLGLIGIEEEAVKTGDETWGTHTLHGSTSQTMFLGTLAPPGVLTEEVSWSDNPGEILR